MAKKEKHSTWLMQAFGNMNGLAKYPDAFDADETRKIIEEGAEALREMIHRVALVGRAIDYDNEVAIDGHIIDDDTFNSLEV